MRFHSYFNSAVKILQSYDGSIPLSHFLKQYFAENKKHGSTDRKFIAHACYCYFRMGHALKELSIEKRLKTAIFLRNEIAGEWYVLYDEEWLKTWSSSLHERVSFVASVYTSFSLNDVFPFAEHLSDGIEAGAFVQSHFVQPDVFLRIRPHHHEHVIRTLQQDNIPFSIIEDDCIELPANINVEKFLKLDEEVVLQDYSSQRIKNYLQLVDPAIKNGRSEMKYPKSEIRNQKSILDCCAGSGGKSILAYDVLQNVQLTATDIRASIIHNLKQRFQKAGIKNYKSFIIDVTKPIPEAFPLGNGESFDLIICDAPCTGSGTWSRTPEQLYFFEAKRINEYAALQMKIITNAVPLRKQDGYFLYVTCSVFKEENEEIVMFIKQQFHLKLIQMELLKGYDKKADTMFVALFQR